MIDYINPNDPTSARLRDEQDLYAKILTLVIARVGPQSFTKEDIEAQMAQFGGTLGAIVVEDGGGKLSVSVVDQQTAAALATEHGGKAN